MDEPEEQRHRVTSPLGRLRTLLVPVAIGAVAVFAAFGSLSEPEVPDFTPTGPPLTLPTQQVPAIDLPQLERMLVGQQGKPVVLNLWASWCAPCRTEMPVLQRAAEAFEGEAVILGVATNDDQERARQFLDELGITYPNVFDTTGEIQEALDLTAFPTTYLFDADGNLQARVNGGISEQRLAGLIEGALP